VGQWTLSLSDNGLEDPLCFASAILTLTTAHTLSGTITMDGAGLAGVTMTGLPGEPVTGADGSYFAIVTHGWSGTAIPTLTGYTIMPAQRIYADVITSLPDQDYTADISIYTVSGTVTDGTNPIEDVTVTFSHNGHTETTAANGTYSYVVAYGTTTTVTPSHPGYHGWSPASRTLNAITANQPNQDFSGTINTYTVSGTVTNGINPIQGATITFSHDGHTETTAIDGTYSYTVNYNTTTTITPTHPGYSTWSPANRTINNISSDQTNQDFTSTSDTDGVTTEEESGPDGTNPNYDGNGDGIPDSNQSNVVSFHTADGNNYVTIAAPNGTQFSGIQALPAPAPGVFPDLLSFPYGLFRFTLSGLTPGGAVQVSLILSGSASINSYWKYGREPGNTTPHPYQFTFTGTTGAQIMGNTVVLHFIDGQRGDDDLDGTKGVIVDDGGPCSTTPHAIPALSKEGMIVFMVLMLLLACWMMRRRRVSV
jgi:hypothetical protein